MLSAFHNYFYMPLQETNLFGNVNNGWQKSLLHFRSEYRNTKWELPHSLRGSSWSTGLSSSFYVYIGPVVKTYHVKYDSWRYFPQIMRFRIRMWHSLGFAIGGFNHGLCSLSLGQDNHIFSPVDMDTQF